MTRPYRQTVEDALWLFESGEWPERIATRLGLKLDTVEQAFRRLGYPVPWGQP